MLLHEKRRTSIVRIVRYTNVMAHATPIPPIMCAALQGIRLRAAPAKRAMAMSGGSDTSHSC